MTAGSSQAAWGCSEEGCTEDQREVCLCRVFDMVPVMLMQLYIAGGGQLVGPQNDGTLHSMASFMGISDVLLWHHTDGELCVGYSTSLRSQETTVL